jgi:uncharacterized membrane protein YfhO
VVTVEPPSDAVVLVRNPYARNWHAKVDGRPVRILPADHLLQGIPVPAGRHRITLTYDDPWIGYGLLGSGIAVLALLVGALLSWRAGAARLGRERRERVSGARSG